MTNMLIFIFETKNLLTLKRVVICLSYIQTFFFQSFVASTFLTIQTGISETDYTNRYNNNKQ